MVSTSQPACKYIELSVVCWNSIVVRRGEYNDHRLPRDLSCTGATTAFLQCPAAGSAATSLLNQIDANEVEKLQRSVPACWSRISCRAFSGDDRLPLGSRGRWHSIEPQRSGNRTVVFISALRHKREGISGILFGACYISIQASAAGDP